MDDKQEAEVKAYCAFISKCISIHKNKKHIDISTPNVFLTFVLLLVPIKKLSEAQELRERGAFIN